MQHEVMNFQLLDDAEVLRWIDANFDRFSSEKDEAYPANALADLARGRLAIVRRKEGIAVAFKGRLPRANHSCTYADLLFLYVLPQHQKKGFGELMVAAIKDEVVPGLPIVLKCEGERRRRYFETLGFVVTEHAKDEDIYEMIYLPAEVSLG